MFEVLNHNLQGVKVGFKQYPFAAWGLCYVMVIALCWPLLSSFLTRVGSLIGVIILSVPLLLLYKKSLKILKMELAHSKQNLTYTRHLSAHQWDRIQSLLPTNQLDLFHDVLLPSLKLLHGALNDIAVSHDKHGMKTTLFDQKFNDICDALKRLTAIPELYSTQQSYKSRDLAITAFTFYRVGYHHVIEMLAQHSHIPQQYDPHILLKRIPDRLLLYLGAQSWRSYEFLEVVYGDLSSLTLNQDLIPFLQNSCGALVAMAVNHYPQPVTTTVEPHPCAVSTASNEQSLIAERFVAWLEQKISGHSSKFHPNADQYIFMNRAQHGQDTVFISHTLLDKYHNEHHLSPTLIKQALRDSGRSTPSQYRAVIDGNTLSLLRVNQVTVKRPVTRDIPIEEVVHG